MPFRRGGFTPASLFVNGEQGVWYDPSDFSTLFQNAAGTTPVTAVEQPVRLMLDKSKGLVLGPELLADTDFDNAGSWQISAGVTISGGVATWNTAGTSEYVRQPSIVEAGGIYEYEVVCSSYTSGTVFVGVGDGGALQTTSPINSVGVVRFRAVALASGRAWLLTPAGGAVLSITRFSVKKLLGNHALAPSDTARPVLRARYNLLTYSEVFSNAVWSLVNVSGSATLVGNTLTFGTSAIDRFVQAGITLVAAQYTASIVMSGSGTVRLFLLGGDGTTGVPTTVTLTATPTRYSVTRTVVAGASGGIGVYNNSGGTPATCTIDAADLRVTNDALNQPSYQRVGAATDYDTNGFLPFLVFDGSDDAMSTSAINFSGTDKMTVFAGVRKLSDAASGVLAELGVGGSNGSFLLAVPLGSVEYQFRSQGTAQGNATADNAAYAAPHTAVLTGQGDISGDSVTIRVNGTAGSPGTADQGTGNYGNLAFNIGARGGSSVFFNGRLTSLIVRGAASSAAEIAATEAYINARTGAY